MRHESSRHQYRDLEGLAANRISLRCLLKKQLTTGKKRILNLAEEWRVRRKARAHAFDQLHLLFMQQGLPLPNWSYQPPTMLF